MIKAIERNELETYVSNTDLKYLLAELSDSETLSFFESKRTENERLIKNALPVNELSTIEDYKYIVELNLLRLKKGSHVYKVLVNIHYMISRIDIKKIVIGYIIEKYYGVNDKYDKLINNYIQCI